MNSTKCKVAGILFFCFTVSPSTQDMNDPIWNFRKCAVALTYDDGLNVHLDQVIPVLDSFGFKATFYIPGNSVSLDKRQTKWKLVAENGHELGNHTLFHPCAGKSKGRDWVNPDYDLDNYTIGQITDEIKLANTLLKAVDGESERTFAYTCGDPAVGDSSFTDLIRNDFIAARGVVPKMNTMNEIDLFHIHAYPVDGQSGDAFIDLVKEALDNNAFIVFLFHGVGGGHSMNISLGEHNKLLCFLKENEKEIWVAPMVVIAKYIKEHKQIPTKSLDDGEH